MARDDRRRGRRPRGRGRARGPRGLEAALEEYADRPLKIGSFSAASNVTGLLTDCDAVSALLHSRGALACWDFAAAAPYTDIRMDPPPGGDPAVRKDAVVLSPHKFVGGPGTPGVLAIRRAFVTGPGRPGGGTVDYVSPVEHVYRADVEHREEGGTPAIVESIRAGSCSSSRRPGPGRDQGARTGSCTGPSPAGDPSRPWSPGQPPRRGLSIVSFTVGRRRPSVRPPQLRRGPAERPFRRAGPRRLLLRRVLRPPPARHRHRAVAAFQQEIHRGCEGIKPGWVRVNLNYFLSEAVVEYLLEAVLLTAGRGGGCCPTTASNRPPDCGGITRSRRNRPCACTSWATAPTASSPTRGTTTARPSPPCPGTWTRRAACSRRAPPSPRTPTPPSRPDADWSELQWFDLPAVCLT